MVSEFHFAHMRKTLGLPSPFADGQAGHPESIARTTLVLTIRCAERASRQPPTLLQRCLQDSRIPCARGRMIVSCSPRGRIVTNSGVPVFHFPLSFFYFRLYLHQYSSAFISGDFKPSTISTRSQTDSPARKIATSAPPLS